ncbi:unnamed protein product [Soboliphyme baturini]|uniref:ARID domain-containing protein n=1 Tax=Soboliphyme baturini TaxID=241478 RepID=A0A183IW61_9BILA|nr:unnamed protein product [Soboliphyme baturini]
MDDSGVVSFIPTIMRLFPWDRNFITKLVKEIKEYTLKQRLETYLLYLQRYNKETKQSYSVQVAGGIYQVVRTMESSGYEDDFIFRAPSPLRSNSLQRRSKSSPSFQNAGPLHSACASASCSNIERVSAETNDYDHRTALSKNLTVAFDPVLKNSTTNPPFVVANDLSEVFAKSDSTSTVSCKSGVPTLDHQWISVLKWHKAMKGRVIRGSALCERCKVLCASAMDDYPQAENEWCRLKNGPQLQPFAVLQHITDRSDLVSFFLDDISDTESTSSDLRTPSDPEQRALVGKSANKSDELLSDLDRWNWLADVELELLLWCFLKVSGMDVLAQFLEQNALFAEVSPNFYCFLLNYPNPTATSVVVLLRPRLPESGEDVLLITDFSQVTLVLEQLVQCFVTLTSTEPV